MFPSIDEIITKIGAAIKAALVGVFGGFFSLDWVPEIFFWYFFLFVLVIAAGTVIFLFGWSKIVRMVVSFIVLGAGLFVAGGAYMVHRLKLRQQIADAKKKKPLPPPKPREDGGGFFGGRW